MRLKVIKYNEIKIISLQLHNWSYKKEFYRSYSIKIIWIKLFEYIFPIESKRRKLF